MESLKTSRTKALEWLAAKTEVVAAALELDVKVNLLSRQGSRKNLSNLSKISPRGAVTRRSSPGAVPLRGKVRRVRFPIPISAVCSKLWAACRPMRPPVLRHIERCYRRNPPKLQRKTGHGELHEAARRAGRFARFGVLDNGHVIATEARFVPGTTLVGRYRIIASAEAESERPAR